MGVLDEMTKGITERKAKAAGPKLTPVGVEANSTKPSLQFAPGESPYPGMRSALERIRAGIVQLDKYVGAIERDITSFEEGKTATIAVNDELDDAMNKAVEGIEPETFAARQTRLAAEAQAAVFTAADAEPESPFNDLPHERPATGWTCPTHGTDSLKQLTSRKGREYMACQVTGCRLFERE
jgi:hypothetical protein